MSQSTVHVYADGSHSTELKVAGFGWVLVFPSGHVLEGSAKCRKVMESWAQAQGLTHLPRAEQWAQFFQAFPEHKLQSPLSTKSR